MRIYLFPKFLKNKPVAKLLDEDLQSSDFNDDTLGKFLDKMLTATQSYFQKYLYHSSKA